MTNLNLLYNLIWLYLLTSIMFLIINSFHPVIMIMIIIIYNIFLSMNMSMWSNSYIYSIFFLLIMITGLLIIFLYFSSIISNEKITKPSLMNMLFLLISLLIMIMTLFMPSMSKLIKINLFMSDDQMILPTNSMMSKSNMIMFYSTSLKPLILMSMMFLLISLISIIKISSSQIKSLRKLSK